MIDRDALAADTAALVRVPSVTGDERAVLERLGELAAGHGLDAELHVYDLDALRAHPGHPGEEAPRTELCGLTVTLPGERPGRVCLNGHIDVVGLGNEAWRDDPWSGRIEDGWLHGRGSVDMKGGVTAALHALLAPARRARIRRRPSCSRRSPRRRTAGWARSPRSSATPPSTPA